MRKLASYLTIVFSLLFLTFSALAQSAGGTLSGRVTDASGATVPNARVELENVATAQRISTVTASDGTYSFSNVPVGTYRLVTLGTATMPANAQEVSVTLGTPVTIDFGMPSGPSTDALVSTTTVPISTDTASIQQSYNTRWVQYLPQPNLVTRDGSAYGAYNLSLLNEAITQSPFGERGPAVAGNRPASNNYHIEGIDNNNKINPGPLVYLPNEATTEFALFNNQERPVFGQSTGGNFNSVMRSGTNQLHGSFYDYLQNRHLNAMDPRLGSFGYTENPRYDQNRLGASVGLPIIPSKFFFFGNFEYIPLGFQGPQRQISYAPTAAGFAQLSQIPGISATNLGILQSSIGTVGATSRFATIAGRQVPLGLVNSNVRGWQNQFIGAGAGDWTISDKDQLRVRYIHNEAEANNSGFGLSAFMSPQRHKSMLGSAGWYHSFGNSLINELRFGFNRYTQYTDPQNAAFGGFSQFPVISIQGESNLGLGPQFGYIGDGALNTYHVAEGLSARIGRHNLRFGVDGRRYLGYTGNFASGLGNYTYSSLGRFLFDLPPDVVAQRSFGTNRFDLNQWLLYGYVADHFTLNPHLTIDASLGYQYATIPTGFDYQQRNDIASQAGVLGFNDINNQGTHFAPRLGIAFAPWSRGTVLRAGWGMFYDALATAQTMIGLAPGVSTNVYGAFGSNTPGFLAGGGINNPVPAGTNVTAAQARALTSAWYGTQQMPYSMQWNAAWEQAIWHKATIEFKYIGNRGVHQPFAERLNAVSGVTAQNNLPLYLSQPTQAQLNALPVTLNQLRGAPANDPFAASGYFSPINGINWGGNSWYNAGVVSLRHQFTGGFQLLANYTYSEWSDDYGAGQMSYFNGSRQKTWSMYDTRHSASVTGMFELAPLFKNTYSIVRNVFADFNINGTYTFQSGQYMPVMSGADVALNGTAFGAGAFYNPNGQAGVGSGVSPLYNGQGQVVAYLANNPNAQWVAAGPGQYPTQGRRGFALPDLHNVDVAAVKRFNVRERWSLEARAEAYNVLNRRNFSLAPVNNLGSMYMPSISGLLIPGNPEFMNLNSALAGNPRTLQLALRMVF